MEPSRNIKPAYAQSSEESDVEDLLSKTELPPNSTQRLVMRRTYQRKWQKAKREKKRKQDAAANVDCELEQVEDSESSESAWEELTAVSDIEGEGPPNISVSPNFPPQVMLPYTSLESSALAHEILGDIDDFDTDDEFHVHRIHEIEGKLYKGNVDSDEELVDLAQDADGWMLPNLQKDGKGTLWSDLRQAAHTTRMNTVQIDAVLSALFKHRESISQELPKSHKTLMKTNSKCLKNDIRMISGHQYYYYPICEQLRFYLNCYSEEVLSHLDMLSLIWNTDGLPLHNSTRWSSWPVLCYISNLKPRRVFEVVLTAGVGKPTDLGYLEEFTHDLKDLTENGLEWKGRIYRVTVAAVVCDAPARAAIKCVKQFSARYGCDFCEKRGEHDGKRIVWVGCDGAVPRTDESFRSQRQPEHHHNDGRTTPLLSLNIDMVLCFPPDFMHQAGGTMKKILLWIIRGPKKSGNGRHVVRMSARNISLLDQRIRHVAQFVPNMFARKLRTTVDLADYKYTELRQLLLYTGKVIFFDLMASEEQYKHFLEYSIACNMMTDKEMARSYHELNKYLIKRVVNGFSDIYGQAFMTYNIHSNLHFPDMAAYHGSLDDISAYPFENHLGRLKNCVTTSHNPMIAMMKEIQRRQAVERENILVPPKTVVYVKPPNNVYIDHIQHRCYEALATVKNRVKCIEFTRVGPFFEQPVSSTLVGCYKVLLSYWRWVYLPIIEIQKLRRGIKINLSEMPGWTDPQITNDSAIFMAVLHNQLDALY